MLLASYSWGGHARRQTAMPDEQIIDEALRAVARVHGMDFKQVHSLFLRGVVKKWGADPYSLGAFVFAYPHHVRN